MKKFDVVVFGMDGVVVLVLGMMIVYIRIEHITSAIKYSNL